MKTLFTIALFCLISCKGKEKPIKGTGDTADIKNPGKGFAITNSSITTTGTLMMDSTKGKVSFLEVTDTAWKGYWKERTNPSQGIVITKKANMNNKPYDSITVDKNGDVTYHAKPHVFSGNIDTIPKKDTRWYSCCGTDSKLIGGQLDNYPVKLVTNNYNDSLQKIIDSLQIEIKKAKYIINLIDSIQKNKQ